MQESGDSRWAWRATDSLDSLVSMAISAFLLRSSPWSLGLLLVGHNKNAHEPLICATKPVLSVPSMAAAIRSCMHFVDIVHDLMVVY
jgi:hypothetical protein